MSLSDHPEQPPFCPFRKEGRNYLDSTLSGFGRLFKNMSKEKILKAIRLCASKLKRNPSRRDLRMMAQISE
jgi:hypothetical protein